jgi:hypothetical protein
MSERAAKAIQDFYPDDFAHCYGCGWLNGANGRARRRRRRGGRTVEDEAFFA